MHLPSTNKWSSCVQETVQCDGDSTLKLTVTHSLVVPYWQGNQSGALLKGAQCILSTGRQDSSTAANCANQCTSSAAWCRCGSTLLTYVVVHIVLPITSMQCALQHATVQYTPQCTQAP